MNLVATNSPAERHTFFEGALVVSSGTRRFDKPKRVNETLPSGVKIVVLLSGRFQIAIGSESEREICGPATIVIRTPHGAPRDQLFAAEVPFRSVIVQLREQLIGADMSLALDGSIFSRKTPASPNAMLMSCPASRMIRALAVQIMTCPIRGPERELYLGGKAMQLAALAMSSCVTDASAARTERLSARDLDRIRQARNLLIEAMREPPGLNRLASLVGINARKLTDGFRRVYGTTVFGFLQEYRMEQAYKLIASGEMSVSEAAYHVGYGAAHFATAFRKRFGVSPSSLR
ncbi:helix-turn-helix transcriptional regulator [Rhodopseudomonas sp.]|uniref:AraC family transcriptional regulator n=1 Tax=Rhodopseudomonas sp. TaxID=1078 RepID=UPI0039E25AEA